MRELQHPVNHLIQKPCAPGRQSVPVFNQLICLKIHTPPPRRTGRWVARFHDYATVKFDTTLHEISWLLNPWWETYKEYRKDLLFLWVSSCLKFLFRTVNTVFIQHYFKTKRASPNFHLHCICNKWVAKCIDSPAFVLLLAACRVYYNINEYFTFSGKRNNMNLCMRQMRCDLSFAIRWKTVSPLSGQSYRRKGRREQGPWEAVGKNSFERSSSWFDLVDHHMQAPSAQ